MLSVSSVDEAPSAHFTATAAYIQDANKIYLKHSTIAADIAKKYLRGQSRSSRRVPVDERLQDVSRAINVIKRGKNMCTLHAINNLLRLEGDAAITPAILNASSIIEENRSNAVSVIERYAGL